MAVDRKISDLDPLAVSPAVDDELEILDISEALDEDKNKRITIATLFDFLADGAWTGDIVLDSTGTLDLQAGTIYINEAVDLTATSTELNQLDGITVGGTSPGDIVTIDGTQTLTNKTLTTPTIADFQNAQHTHATIANGGQLTQPLINEAVALLATATELNQLDNVTVGGTSPGDIVTIDGTQTLTNKTLTTPTIADFTNATHDHADAAGGGNTLTIPTIGDFTNAQHDHSSASEGGGITRTVYLEVYSPTTAAAAANDLIAFVVPPELNGWNLTNVIAGVYVLGVAGTEDVMIHRRRAGANVDMLTTPVTIDPTEYFAQDGVIDAANDDVQTGDSVVVDIDAVHSTTPADGTFVALTFSLP